MRGYKELVEKRTIEVAGNSCNWLTLLRNSLNVEPKYLWATLKEMISKGIIIETDGLYTPKYPTRKAELLSYEHFKKGGLSRFLRELPDESPVYSQYWYLPNVYHALENFIWHFDCHCEKLFLGSPTLGTCYAVSTTGYTTVADIDVEMIKRCKEAFEGSQMRGDKVGDFTVYDVEDELPERMKNAYGLVWIDPPWGKDLMKKFMLRSIQALKLGGHLIVALPQLLTRPDMEEEIDHLLMVMSSCGMKLTKEHPNMTSYNLPEFEKNACEAVGIPMTEPWRTGDIYIFEKVSDENKMTEWEIASIESHKNEWCQIADDKFRIFFKPGVDSSDTISIELIDGMDHPILPTTSSRSEFWGRADIVTTDNHVVKCNNPRLLSEYLKEHSWENFLNALGNLNKQNNKLEVAVEVTDEDNVFVYIDPPESYPVKFIITGEEKAEPVL